ncbi:LON peptidase substrate-binding domain-containing protein [Rhodoferax bucti]|uniref:LON peptidase substrate-binding domain-containing protein n=1 Tax=Rhodoferax bucti TaxID=2576305 RepID=UPI00110908F5|nr:LON peptidase substrate-binding domain-containing protein [Rhodoferax bucti]
MSDLLTLQSLPLFPLNTVLFPGGSLQLQIFEVRYLDLISRCDDTGAPFGIVALTKGEEVRRPDPQARDGVADEVFADVGTLTTVSTLSAPKAGLLLVRCTAGERFRITRRERLKHGLWVADVELLPADQAVPVPDDLRVVSQALQSLLENLHLRGEGDRLSAQLPYRFDDCAWVANRWCELLQLPQPLRQSLLELDSPLLRLELVGDFLNRSGIAEV